MSRVRFRVHAHRALPPAAFGAALAVVALLGAVAVGPNTRTLPLAVSGVTAELAMPVADVWAPPPERAFLAAATGEYDEGPLQVSYEVPA